MTQKRAFEEQEFVLNVTAQIQQCSYETKGIQKLLYFEKNESSKERIAVEASVMMYEWCEDLNELTGKKYQDIAQGCCRRLRWPRPELPGRNWQISLNRRNLCFLRYGITQGHIENMIS